MSTSFFIFNMGKIFPSVAPSRLFCTELVRHSGEPWHHVGGTRHLPSTSLNFSCRASGFLLHPPWLQRRQTFALSVSPVPTPEISLKHAKPSPWRARSNHFCKASVNNFIALLNSVSPSAPRNLPLVRLLFTLSFSLFVEDFASPPTTHP